jgi:hypothetical protein
MSRPQGLSRLSALRRLLTSALMLSIVAGFAFGVGLPGRASAQDAAQQTDATVRVINASPGAPALDVLVNGQPLAKNLAFGQPTSYAALKQGSYKIQVVPTGQAADNALAEKDIDLDSGGAYLISVLNPLKDISINVDKVDLDPVDSGSARIRLLNESSDAGKIDLVVTGGDKWFSGVDQGDASDQKSVAAGTYSLNVQSSDNQTLTTVTGLNLQDGQVYDLVAIGQISDKSFTLISLATSVTPPCAQTLGLAGGTATDACVRVIHAAPGSPAVDLYVNGAVATSGLGFASSTAFLLVPSGDSVKFQTTATGASLDTTLTSDTISLDAGQAYQFVVTGEPNDLKLTQMRLDLSPLPAGQARLRVVNASPDAGSIDLAVKDGDTLIKDVDFRDVSDYQTHDAATLTLDALNHGGSTVLSEGSIDLQAGTVSDILLVGETKDQSLAFVVVTSPAPTQVGAVATPAVEGTQAPVPTVTTVATQSSTVMPMTTAQTAPTVAATP